MSFHMRPHIGFALPGIHYTADNAYTLCTVPIVPYLEKDFEITLIYRKLHDSVDPMAMAHQYLTILGEAEAGSARERKNQQRFFSPDSYNSLHRYRKALQQFAQHQGQRFDFVIEKQWPWLGAAVNSFVEAGIPASLVLEAWWRRKPGRPVDEAKAWVKSLLSPGLQKHRLARCRDWSQQASSIITETQEMGNILREQDYIPRAMPQYTIPNGMDAEIFYPRDRQHCRQELGIDPNITVLTYVGSLAGWIQETRYLIEALGREQQVSDSQVLLYVVGDGGKRAELEAIARKHDTPITFTGRVDQVKAAQYIGAADLCIAPYDLSIFCQNRFTSGSLKVPEYLACGRLVVATACEHMAHMTAHGDYGFLVENSVEGYRQFLRCLPSQIQRISKEEKLQRDLQSGLLRRQKILMPWSDIAELYKEVIHEALAKDRLAKDRGVAKVFSV